jgi:hypothetical protein
MGGTMHINVRLLLSLVLGLGILTTAFAAERVVVCEQAYQED